MKKSDIWNILSRKFPAGQYALMAEVRDAAGFSASRSADYVAMNLWPSRGLAITGIELKSFRGDWLNELKNPKKAEAIFQYCDYFYLLTSEEGITNLNEIPATWGWMCIKWKTIKIIKEAPKLIPALPSKDFMACMLKRASDKTEWVHRDSIQEEISAAKESNKTIHEQNERRYVNEISEFKKTIKEFEDAAGVRFGAYSWNGSSPEKIGQAVKFINNGGIEGVKNELLTLQKQAETIHNKITEILSQ